MVQCFHCIWTHGNQDTDSQVSFQTYWIRLFGSKAQKYALTSFPHISYAQKHPQISGESVEKQEDPGWAKELPTGGVSGAVEKHARKQITYLVINKVKHFYIHMWITYSYPLPIFLSDFFLLISKTPCLLCILQLFALLICHLPFNFVSDIFFSYRSVMYHKVKSIISFMVSEFH